MPRSVEQRRPRISIGKILGTTALGAVAVVGLLLLTLVGLGPVMNSVFPGSQYRTSTTSPRLVEVTLGPTIPSDATAHSRRLYELESELKGR